MHVILANTRPHQYTRVVEKRGKLHCASMWQSSTSLVPTVWEKQYYIPSWLSLAWQEERKRGGGGGGGGRRDKEGETKKGKGGGWILRYRYRNDREVVSCLALEKLARADAENKFLYQDLRESNLLHAQSLLGCPQNWGRQQASEQQDQTFLCKRNLFTDNTVLSLVPRPPFGGGSGYKTIQFCAVNKMVTALIKCILVSVLVN